MWAILECVDATAREKNAIFYINLTILSKSLYKII